MCGSRVAYHSRSWDLAPLRVGRTTRGPVAGCQRTPLRFATLTSRRAASAPTPPHPPTILKQGARYWTRRTTDENRLVFRVSENEQVRGRRGRPELEGLLRRAIVVESLVAFAQELEGPALAWRQEAAIRCTDCSRMDEVKRCDRPADATVRGNLLRRRWESIDAGTRKWGSRLHWGSGGRSPAGTR